MHCERHVLLTIPIRRFQSQCNTWQRLSMRHPALEGGWCHGAGSTAGGSSRESGLDEQPGFLGIRILFDEGKSDRVVGVGPFKCFQGRQSAVRSQVQVGARL